MTIDTTARKDIQKLQRAIVDGLEDVKGQDIRVFNTEHLSPLFERVVIASGTSNRQTKALASSVRDAVREAGFDKPRMEGEDNGEWIIVDCGQAVVHVMQPAIRQYYRLEEIWGEKAVRLRSAAPARPTAPASTRGSATGLAKPASRQAAPAKASPAKAGAAKASTPKASTPKASTPKASTPKAAAAKAPRSRAGAAPASSAPTAAARKRAGATSGARPPAKAAAKRAAARS